MTDETILHLGCGDDRKSNAHNVDYRETPATDEVVDLNDRPWPWDDESFRWIIGEHVFEHLDDLEGALRECERVLEPGGELKIAWPIGMNERADPDHKHTLVWDSPEMMCGKRPWDVDVGLEVDEKDAYIGSHFSGLPGVLYGGLIRALEFTQGPDRWMFDMPVTSGEFEVVFKKP